MRRPLFSWLLALTFTAGCGNSDVLDPGDRAALRLYNAVPDSPQLNFSWRGAVLGQGGLGYKFGRQYTYILSGSGQIDVTIASTGDIVLGHSAVLETGSAYTFAATGTLATPRAVLLTDDTTAAPTGSFKVRLVHLAPLGPAADLYITGSGGDITTATPAASGIPFTQASAYVTGTPGTPKLWVTQTGTKTVLATNGPVAIASGQGATLFLVGKEGAGGGGAPYSGQLIADHAGTN